MATNVPIEGALLPRSIKLSIDLLSCVLVASSSNVNPCASRKDRTFEPITVSTFFVSTAADPFLLVAISLCPHHHRLSKRTGCKHFTIRIHHPACGFPSPFAVSRYQACSLYSQAIRRSAWNSINGRQKCHFY
jgi:hypothetical protein